MAEIEKFNEWINHNYDSFKKKMIAYCSSKKMNFDEDVFHETLVKLIEKIEKNGMLQADDKGFENYFFKAFKRNIKREKQYARNAKRDDNIKNINGLYEKYLAKTNVTDKIQNDAYIDFAVLYCIRKAENVFDEKIVRLFCIKYFSPHMTYKKLSDNTDEKNIRQKLLNLKNWMKNNISEEEIMKAFKKKYEI